VRLVDSLPPAHRAALFALMRQLGAEADVFFARGREEHDRIPVGAALFDETLRGAARHELVNCLRTADTLDDAHEAAKRLLEVWVLKHNARRPRDMHWQRWTGAGQSELLSLVHRVRDIVGTRRRRSIASTA